MALMRLGAAGVVFLAAASVSAAADDPLARARLLYNQKQFEAAVTAAEQARATAAHADAADLIAARAYLERFRMSAASDDLTNARDRLRRIDPQRFTPRERTEYVIGLGEALFFDGNYGAAADVFDSLLQSRDGSTAEARDRVLDWWATAMDRQAKPRPEMDRQAVYQQIRTRMSEELAVRPASSAAAYWSAAAARAQGDHQAAWDAAQAGWVRSALAGPATGEELRSDLDRLVQRGIIPDRARATAQPPESLRAQWEQFKDRWRREQ
jgi:tetratricopeptide (TPR) repeat protein